jgi:crotonobetainyl-CoA:carnitine CoA-transferase CaiB-like acyl-CoA transferase
MDKPILGHIRVIEFANGIAGPAAGLQLSEAGAEVIRIETPAMADDAGSVLFSVLNRGKRRVALDIEMPDGRAALAELIAGADVLLHDLTPAQAAACGLDDARLAAAHPGLIVSAITGWPRQHRLADAPPRETLVLARLGLLDEQPGHRAGPVFVRMPFAGWLAAWLCAIGVMARLVARRRDGRGGIAHTSLAQAALAPMSMHWSRAETPTPVFAKGLSKSTPIPLHRCADGEWVHVHYSPDKAPWMAQALAAMGPEAVAAENAKYPPSHVAPNFGANKAIMATRPARDWVGHFWQHDVAAQVAAPFGAIYASEQARTNGYVVAVEDRVRGTVLQPGPAYLTEPPPQVRGALAEPDGGALPLRDRPWAAVSDSSPFAALAPLAGMKVLDLGAYLAGPFATMLLADLGAEVIKVEPPAGDAMRRLERIFAGTQRGKLGVALKLGEAGAADALDALVRWADVVHHNIRLPAARKLGIDYAALQALNPALVYCHISSYGPLGEQKDWPGFDQLMQAACGWEAECGGQGNPPMWLRFGVGDYLAALSSVFAVLLAHYRRLETGEGQAVCASLLGATLLTVAESVMLADGATTPVAQLDKAQTGLSPDHRIYRCLDAWLAVAAMGAHETQAFAGLAGSTQQQREAWFAEQRRECALAALRDAGIAAEPVLEAQGDAFHDDPDHEAAGLHARYRHAVYGELEQVGAYWDFGDLPLTLSRPPPALGEHSREVWERLGLTPGQIAALEEQGLTILMNASGASV